VGGRTLLDIQGLDAYYGQSHVLQGISIKIEPKEMVALIGRNGAGKTTILKSIIGIEVFRKGLIKFQGEDITNYKTHVICRKGIAIVPEDRRIFPNLSVRENLNLGMLYVNKKDWTRTLDEILSYFPILRDRLIQRGGSMSGGEQQMLAIARALVSRPKLMLIDEPSEGLMPMVVATLVEAIKRANRAGTTILLVEQNIELSLRELCKRAYIIDQGTIPYSGDADEILQNEEIKQKFLLI
jgi:branched-chain amino acid transport system ATP-binding protein